MKAGIHPSEDVQFQNMDQGVTEIFKETSNVSVTGNVCVNSSFFPVGSRILPWKVNGSIIAVIGHKDHHRYEAQVLKKKIQADPRISA